MKKTRKIQYILAFLISVLLVPFIFTTIFSKQDNSIWQELLREQHSEDLEELVDVLTGRLAMQMPVEYEKEALKAQSVLIWTEVYRLRASGMADEEIMKELNCFSQDKLQETWGKAFDENYSKLKEAILETEGKVLKKDGAYIVPAFHRLSGKRTRDGAESLSADYTYLKSVENPQDLLAEDYCSIILLKDIVEEAKWSEYQELEIVERDSAGYVTKIMVNKEEWKGETFRQKLKLPSANFLLDTYEESYRFTCFGIGHGFGLSQYTANLLAKEGQNYEQVLNHFFQNITIETE